MPFSQTKQYGSNGGGGGGIADVTGNGVVIHINGKLYGIEMRGIYPVFVDNPTGQDGNISFGEYTSLGEQRNIDLSVVGDTAIQIGPYLSQFDIATFGLIRGVVAGAQFSIYTKVNGGGEKLFTVTPDKLATLIDYTNTLSYKLTDEPKLYDWLYLRVEVANPTPLKVSVYFFGKTLIRDDETSLPM